MIKKKQVTKYEIDLSVIPVSNDYKRFPIRAQYGITRSKIHYGPVDERFLVLIDTKNLPTPDMVEVVNRCALCKQELKRTDNSLLRGFYITPSTWSIKDKSIFTGFLMPTELGKFYHGLSVITYYAKVQGQACLVTAHTTCKEAYELAPGGDVELEINDTFLID